MADIDFNIESLEPVTLSGPDILMACDLMSPYVWQMPDGKYGVMVRAVPRAGASERNTGTIWYGCGSDGLTFNMDSSPIITPGPDADDIGGCEDPTVVYIDGRYIVYYTGVDASFSAGQMLYATGDDVHCLKKMGVALASSKTEANTKEATITRTADGRWRLFYEYAKNDASLVGLAIGEGVAGPWHEQPAPFSPRADSWDNFHLSTGPLLTTNADMPVMFYNGATADARWRIGWVAFNRDCTTVIRRCIEPLIVPPPQLQRAAADIAFAASVVSADKGCYLYYSLADRTLERAKIRQS